MSEVDESIKKPAEGCHSIGKSIDIWVEQNKQEQEDWCGEAEGQAVVWGHKKEQRIEIRSHSHAVRSIRRPVGQKSQR